MNKLLNDNIEEANKQIGSVVMKKFQNIVDGSLTFLTDNNSLSELFP